jgi:hypothetical protein
MMDKAELIPEAKLREACAKCMQHAKHARYFNEAPSGAKQYIALVFFETVFPNDLTEEVSEQCFKEMLHELNADDLLYLIAHEKDPRTRDVFVERLAFLKEDAALKDLHAQKPRPAVAERPAAARPVPPTISPAVASVAAPTFAFSYDAHRLDRKVAAWNGLSTAVCVSLVLILLLGTVYALCCLAIYKGWLRVWY